MKGIILYESKYGATRDYAQWLSEETGFEVRELKEKIDFQKYDTVVIGSWIMAEKPKSAKWILKNWDKLKDKRTALFTTSGADKEDPVLMRGFEEAFGEKLKDKIRYFPLNGRIIISKLNWFDRQIMKLAVKMVAKKDPEKAAKMGEDVDRVKREDLKVIIEWIKSGR